MSALNVQGVVLSRVTPPSCRPGGVVCAHWKALGRTVYENSDNREYIDTIKMDIMTGLCNIYGFINNYD